LVADHEQRCSIEQIRKELHESSRDVWVRSVNRKAEILTIGNLEAESMASLKETIGLTEELIVSGVSG
jgi:hypothetical protein